MSMSGAGRFLRRSFSLEGTPPTIPMPAFCDSCSSMESQPGVTNTSLSMKTRRCPSAFMRPMLRDLVTPIRFAFLNALAVMV